ncbi:LPS export ABC transporter permease LptF [Pseudomonadota bacterium]
MIVNRALMRETLQTSGAVTLVMLTIFMVVRLVGFLRQAVNGDFPVDSILILLLLKMISYVDVILPLMLYVAILMVLGRWNRDNEMSVWAACGVGLTSFLRPMLYIVLIMGALVSAFSLYLAPLAVRVSKALELEFSQHNDISGVVTGIFEETRGGSGVYFVERFDKDAGNYRNIFVYNSEPKNESVVISKSARQMVDELTNDQFLVLQNGTRYDGNPGEPDYRIMEFETYAVRLKQRPKGTPAIPLKGRTTQEVFMSSKPLMVTEWHWRISKTLSLPVLVLFALAFSNLNPRNSRIPNVVMAFVAYFSYTNLLGFGVAMMKKGTLNPHYGLWFVHVVFLIIAIYLFSRRSENRPILPSLRFRLAH